MAFVPPHGLADTLDHLVGALVGSDPAVLGDRIELQQVLLNLMLNTCDAMSGLPTGKRALTVRTELSPDGGVQVSVTDEGPGVPASPRRIDKKGDH